MSEQRKKIANKLHESTVDKAAMERKWDDKLDAAKDVISKSLPNETPEEVDDIAANLAKNYDEDVNENSVGRGIEVGMNPEVESDKYAEYKALMAQLAAEEGSKQLNNVTESKEIKMTKNKLVETVTGRKIIKTIKVKDIK